jgi:23S rRNA (guanosine2251-2'-O)-methyltransferase
MKETSHEAPAGARVPGRGEMGLVVYGINPVLEALRAGRVTRLLVGARQYGRLAPRLEAAAGGAVRLEVVDETTLDRAARGGAHQGVVAEMAPPRRWTIPELVAAAARPPLFVVLDGVEDPRNVGAILRTCEAAGVDGVIRQTRRAAPLDGATAKAAAGALVHLRIAEVVNVGRALDALKAAGVWTVGLAADAERAYDAVDYTGATALVLGGEGTGLRRLVRARCDWVVAIPLRGHVQSLNVSVAAGIALFEVLRQRRAASARGVSG